MSTTLFYITAKMIKNIIKYNSIIFPVAVSVCFSLPLYDLCGRLYVFSIGSETYRFKKYTPTKANILDYI